MMPLRCIVVGIDFSELSQRALTTAIELARDSGAEIHLVHAFDIRVPFVTPYEVAVPDHLISEARDAAARKLEEALGSISAAGVKAKSHLEEVPASSAIVRVATELEADLVVMGTHGNTGLKHVLLGSVAERTLRLAPCSVLTVKEPSA